MIKDRKFPGRMLLAIAVLSVGYIVCEYRLFYMMLFDDEVTIRSTIVAGSYTVSEVLATIGDSLVKVCSTQKASICMWCFRFVPFTFFI